MAEFEIQFDTERPGSRYWYSKAVLRANRGRYYKASRLCGFSGVCKSFLPKLTLHYIRFKATSLKLGFISIRYYANCAKIVCY